MDTFFFGSRRELLRGVGRSVCALCVCLVVAPSLAMAAYRLTDLGILTDLPDRTESRPYAVNATGQVAITNLVGGAYRAQRFDGATLNLGTLGGGASFASGINDAGAVAGRSLTSSGETRAFLWTAGGTSGPPANPQMQNLGTLAGGTSSEASAVNNLGQATGYSKTTTRDHAFLWTAGTMRDLGALAAYPNSYGFSLNDSGHVVGTAYNTFFTANHAFWHDGTTMRDLGTLGGASSTALDINDNRQIVGYSTLLDGTIHAFRYDGMLRDLGTLGGNYSYAYGLNSAGFVVGGSYADSDDSDYVAFIHDGVAMRNLNALVDSSAAGWKLVEAYDINASGQIIGAGELAGQRRGFLLSPIPADFVGDANRDRRVDLLDIVALQHSWGLSSGATWEQGDFDGDGKTTPADLALLVSNYGRQLIAARSSAIPEPSCIALLATAVTWLSLLSRMRSWFSVASLRRQRRCGLRKDLKRCDMRFLRRPLLIVCGLIVVVDSANAGYRVTDLGPIADAPDVTESRPYAVNATGQLALTNYSSGAYHAYRYDGAALDVGTLGGSDAAAFGINSSGQIVGRSLNASGDTRAFLWTLGGTNGVATNPQMRDLGVLNGGDHSEAFAVNASGQVVGYSDASMNQPHAFLYTGGAMRDLGGLPGFPNSFAYGINTSGKVAGTVFNPFYALSKAFYYDGNRMRDIGNLGGLFTSALAINDQNRIVGYGQVVTGVDEFVDHAFHYDGQTMKDLGTLGGHYSYALGINNQDAVVGGAFVDADDNVYHAFVYSNGLMRDLNTLAGPFAVGWTFEEARAISDNGHIVGTGYFNGQLHGFLLTPASDPLPGDINLDGEVTRVDAALFASHFGTASLSTWATGDFDGDGATTLQDLAMLQLRLGPVTSLAVSSSAVPEPSGWLILATGTLILEFWRRGGAGKGNGACSCIRRIRDSLTGVPRTACCSRT